MKQPEPEYQPRFYRKQVLSEFGIEAGYQESDLYISSDRRLDKLEIVPIIQRHYQVIKDYCCQNPKFMSSLSPIARDAAAPDIARDMIEAGIAGGVGPFASVAGAVALYVGKGILALGPEEVIVENGGDIFLKINSDKKIGVFLGIDAVIPSVTLNIRRRPEAFGIASSSAKLGHSLNFGAADLVTVIAASAILADSFATALSNRIKNARDAAIVVKETGKIKFIYGILACIEGKIFLRGDLELAG